jgi:hypothetical protein
VAAAALYPQRRLAPASIGELIGPSGCFAPRGRSTLPKPGRVITTGRYTEQRAPSPFTAHGAREEPGLLAPAPARRLNEGKAAASLARRGMSADEQIAETWREVAECKRKNSHDGGRRGGWFRW